MAKKASKSKTNFFTRFFALLGVLLLIAIVVAAYVSLQAPLCEDQCDVSSCSGYDFISCSLQEDRCLGAENLGPTVGECDVGCLVDADCGDGYLCSSSYSCVSLTPEVETPVVVPSSPLVPAVDLCGNNRVDAGETCSSCPKDAACVDGYSCRFGSCEEIGMTSDTGVIYCGYERGHFGRDVGTNLARDAIQGASSCGDPLALFDGVYTLSESRWLCPNVKFPQWAAFELPEEVIVNRMRVLGSHMGNQDFNVGLFDVFFSVDSTNGEDGHWMLVAEDELMPLKYNAELEVFTDPISTKWVKIEVTSPRGLVQDDFALSEVMVYEADLVCMGDYEEN